MKQPLITALCCALTALVTYVVAYFQIKGLS